MYKSVVLLACPQKGLLASLCQTETAKMLARKMILGNKMRFVYCPWFLPFSCTKEAMVPLMLCGQTARVHIIEYLNKPIYINNSIKTKNIIYDDCQVNTYVYFLTYTTFNFKAWEIQISWGTPPLEIQKDILYFLACKLSAENGTNKLCQLIALLYCVFRKNSYSLRLVCLLARNNYILS